MISIETLEIKSLTDYDRISGIVNDGLYVNQSLIDEIKDRIGLRAKRIVIESPYSDLDYNSVYSSFYSKQHKERPKDCYRLHFFSEETFEKKDYRGFLILRPSYIGRSMGRGQLDPRLLLDPGSAFIMQSSGFIANLGGERYNVSSFPWMAQETDISICAHSATWSIVRYFSQKYPHHQQQTLDDIVRLAPPFLNRKVPSDGLNFLQISSILSQAGFHCLFLSNDIQGADKVKEHLRVYIESGIPVIGGIKRTQHAVVLAGHGPIDYGKLPPAGGDRVLSSSLIDSLIAVDDNYLPYLEVGLADTPGGYNVDDIDYAIVPLYEKMFLPADIILSRVTSFIDKGGLGAADSQVLRPYLTSSRSLKAKAAISTDMPDGLVDTILSVEMPKFVWCVDIGSVDEYRNNLCSSRIIIDSTAGTYDPNPWILVHNDNRIIYYDRTDASWRNRAQAIAPYPLYRNNLKEV